ncbi:lysylphosphatidylglycerol synthase transmembrane domain-containing protein [Persicobacter sp. CCB-QB2]|uniref:lysylphosphatidylglycerol synthase transmembrane domain-containing protein n=1 Tax=Persicobacter sp. CCB-QB2 TaxID=1561025 RepID=UPI0006A97777|nr:lysylphosphatidylglycerol synthase transmembrane domain-containing protein [Persicobacter sp. CCB-QB2]
MKQLKQIAQYILSLSLALGLLYYVFRDMDFSDFQARAEDLTYGWIYVSFAMALISHWARAYRWNLLLKPLGYQHLSVWRTFLAVMVGYFANLIIPRAGEVARCAILAKSDKVPLSTGVGSVVAERLFDFIILLVSVALVLFLEFEVLFQFLSDLISEKFGQSLSLLPLVSVMLALGLLGMTGMVYLWRFKRAWLRKNAFFVKIESFLEQLTKGLLSFRSIENKWGFVLSTIVIWAMYFTMSFVIFFAWPETAHFGPRIGLTLFVMGGLGMAAPVQGGIGAYHWIVSRTLALYGLPLTDGVFFATVLHTSQTVMLLIVGGISLAISLILFGKDQKVDQQKAPLVKPQ